MPKKSKKQKIMASLRNKEKFSPVTSALNNTMQTSSLSASMSPKPYINPLSVPAPSSPSPFTAENTLYFKADMKKSFVLILSIITLEIIFYFVSMSTSLGRLANF